MAKKRTQDAIVGSTTGLMDLTRPAEPKAEKPKPKGSSSSETISARIKTAESVMLQEIADEHGISRSLLVRYILNWWARAYQDGDVEIEFEKTLRPKLS